MPVQSSYSATQAAGKVGARANMEPARVISRTIEDSAGAAFGVAVVQGTEDNEVSIDLTGATEIVGFTVRDRAVDPATPDKYAQYATAAIMVEGVIWLEVDDAGGVSAGDDVWLNISTGGLSNADAGSGNGLKLAGCRWETSAADDGLAQVRVNMNVPAVAGAA